MNSLLPEGISDPYELLGVAHDASLKDIKRAYRNKARKVHPDKCPGDPEAQINFHRLQTAFEFLEDTKKRDEYDGYLRRDAEKKERYKRQTAEKRKFAEKLEKAEQHVKNLEHSTTAHKPSGEKLRKENLRRAREENEEWLAHHLQRRQQQLKTSSTTISTSISDRSQPATSSSSPYTSSSPAFVEIKWDEAVSMSPLGVTRSSLNSHFASFSSPSIINFDVNRGKAVLQFLSRERAIEAVLHFMQNKNKYPFTVKLLKTPPSNLSAAKIPTSSTTHTNTSTRQSDQKLADAELDVLNRLRQAAKRQKEAA